MKRLCEVVRVIDGDTLRVEVPLGFGVSILVDVRVVGLETWELASDDRWRAESVRAWVVDWIGEDRRVVCEGDSSEKYGRWLATVTRPGDGADLAKSMIAAGVGWERLGRGHRMKKHPGAT